MELLAYIHKKGSIIDARLTCKFLISVFGELFASISKTFIMKMIVQHKLRTFRTIILNTILKDRKSRKNVCTENFTYTKKPP